MAWAKPTTITAWSFSRWKTYDQCPLKCKLENIDKIKEPIDPNGPMERGNQIHKLAEAFIKGEGSELPDELGYFPNFFVKMRNLYAKQRANIAVEDTWAFRKDWTITTWNDWAECWLRVKLDCAWLDKTTLNVIDHKTGKYSPQYNLQEYVLQVELYALSALIVHAAVGPKLRVIPRLHFLDHEIIYPEPGSKEEKVYTPADLPRLKKEWEARTRPMLNDKTFAPKPNSMCRFCWHGQDGKKKGGPGICKF